MYALTDDRIEQVSGAINWTEVGRRRQQSSRSASPSPWRAAGRARCRCSPSSARAPPARWAVGGRGSGCWALGGYAEGSAFADSRQAPPGAGCTQHASGPRPGAPSSQRGPLPDHGRHSSNPRPPSAASPAWRWSPSHHGQRTDLRDAAPALPALAQGRDAGRPDRASPASCSCSPRALRAELERPAAAAAAVHPALGPEPLRRAGQGVPARRRGDPRPGARRAPAADGRGVDATSPASRSSCTPAADFSRAAERQPVTLRQLLGRVQRAEALAGADLRCSRCALAGLRAADAVLHAVGGRRACWSAPTATC